MSSASKHQCGVWVEAVREALRIVAVTRLPEGPGFLEGIIDRLLGSQEGKTTLDI